MTEHSVSHTTPASAPKKPRRKVSLGKSFLLLLFLVLFIGLLVTGYLYYTTRQQLNLLSTPQGQQQLSAKEVEIVQAQLSKLTLLPDESPVMATITDAAYLATQSAFYQRSENGDKVIVYPNAKKAFIYSPSRNIIVNSGPLVNDASNQQVSLEVRNGSNTNGLGDKVKTDLEAQGVTVATVGNASRRTYTQTVVIGMNENVPANVLQGLATYLKGEVGTELPAGEADSESDVLIIVGESSADTASSDVSPSPATVSTPAPSATPEP